MRESRIATTSVAALGLLSLVALNGCGDATTEPSDTIVRTAMVEEVFANVVTPDPVRVELTVTGNFRDSCAEIGEIRQTRSENRFEVSIMTTRPADAVCSQVLVPFDETIVLMDTEGLAPGDYVVVTNGVREEFTLEAPPG